MRRSHAFVPGTAVVKDGRVYRGLVGANPYLVEPASLAGGDALSLARAASRLDPDGAGAESTPPN